MGGFLGTLGVGIGTLIVNGIGFWYLTRNHLAHLQESVDRIETTQKIDGERIARIEGRLERR